MLHPYACLPHRKSNTNFICRNGWENVSSWSLNLFFVGGKIRPAYLFEERKRDSKTTLGKAAVLSCSARLNRCFTAVSKKKLSFFTITS